MSEVKRYSEAFKLKVIGELESGKYSGPYEAGQVYGLGAGTAARWVMRYGKNHLLGKVIRVMKADEQAEVQALRKQVKELKGALADAHLDLKLEAAYVKLACRAAGIEDVESFKKKHAGER